MTRTNALETLVISCWVRGLSDRDVEAMLVEVFGEQATISRTTASRICQRLRAEFDAWRRRDLSTVRLDYLYVDGSFFKLHPKVKAEPVLAAWGIDTDGKPVLLGLGPGATESTDVWRGFLQDMTDRGLGAPLLVISDGGKGLCTAIECSLPDSLPPRSPVWPTTSTRCWSTCCSRPSTASASRHSNLIERTFGETRRRVKVIGRLPGEQSCLSLVWAVLDRASKGRRGLTMTPKALRRMQDLRRELLAEPPGHHGNEEVVAEAVTAAA